MARSNRQNHFPATFAAFRLPLLPGDSRTLSPKPKSRPLAIVAATPPSRPPSMKLRACFERWYLPELTEDRTIEPFDCALRLWKKLTGDPDVDKITDETLILFRDRLLAMVGGPRRSTSTAGIRWRSSAAWGRSILGTGGARYPETHPVHPQAGRAADSQADAFAGLPLRLVHRRPARPLARDGDYYPRRIWRVLICLVYNAARGRGTCWPFAGMTWTLPRESSGSPPADGETAGDPAECRFAVASGKNCGTHELVFPAPYCPWDMAREAKRMQIAGGIDTPHTIHDLRRTSITAFDRFQRGLGKSSADRPKSVTEAYYDIPSARFGTPSPPSATRRLSDDRRRTRRGRTHSAADRRPVDELPLAGQLAVRRGRFHVPRPPLFHPPQGLVSTARLKFLRRWWSRPAGERVLPANSCLAERGTARRQHRPVHVRQRMDVNTILRKFFGWSWARTPFTRCGRERRGSATSTAGPPIHCSRMDVAGDGRRGQA